MKRPLMGAVAGGGVFPVRDRVEPQGDALVPGEERGEPERDHSAAVPAAERGDGALDAEGDAGADQAALHAFHPLRRTLVPVLPSPHF